MNAPKMRDPGPQHISVVAWKTSPLLPGAFRPWETPPGTQAQARI